MGSVSYQKMNETKMKRCVLLHYLFSVKMIVNNTYINLIKTNLLHFVLFYFVIICSLVFIALFYFTTFKYILFKCVIFFVLFYFALFSLIGLIKCVLLGFNFFISTLLLIILHGSCSSEIWFRMMSLRSTYFIQCM